MLVLEPMAPFVRVLVLGDGLAFLHGERLFLGDLLMLTEMADTLAGFTFIHSSTVGGFGHS